MKAAPVFKAEVQKYRVSQALDLVFSDYGRYANHLRQIGEGQPVEVIIRKPQQKRSDALNRYHWGVLMVHWSEITGYDPVEAHYMLLAEYAKRRNPDKKYPPGLASSKMTNSEMLEFHQWARRFALEEFSHYIPEPNEVDV